MALETNVVVEVMGEGVADIGSEQKSDLPDSGIVPILLHKLCGKPSRMRIKHKPVAFLSGKGLAKKVQFAKRQAFYNRSHAAVFVVDSEGGHKELQAKLADLENGRDRELPDFRMAVGVAQPCIESWLLAAPEAIRRGLQLVATPQCRQSPRESRPHARIGAIIPRRCWPRWSGAAMASFQRPKRTKSPPRSMISSNCESVPARFRPVC